MGTGCVTGFFTGVKVKVQGKQTDPAQIRAAADLLLGTQLQALVGQGYLRKDNGAYSTTLLYRGGQVVVNGKPLGGGSRRGD